MHDPKQYPTEKSCTVVFKNQNRCQAKKEETCTHLLLFLTSDVIKKGPDRYYVRRDQLYHQKKKAFIFLFQKILSVNILRKFKQYHIFISRGSFVDCGVCRKIE